MTWVLLCEGRDCHECRIHVELFVLCVLCSLCVAPVNHVQWYTVRVCVCVYSSGEGRAGLCTHHQVCGSVYVR